MARDELDFFVSYWFFFGFFRSAMTIGLRRSVQSRCEQAIIKMRGPGFPKVGGKLESNFHSVKLRMVFFAIPRSQKQGTDSTGTLVLFSFFLPPLSGCYSRYLTYLFAWVCKHSSDLLVACSVPNTPSMETLKSFYISPFFLCCRSGGDCPVSSAQRLPNYCVYARVPSLTAVEARVVAPGPLSGFSSLQFRLWFRGS